MSTEDIVSKDGDSGGPWYSHVNTTYLQAAGVHSGSRSSFWVADRSYFTPIINQSGNNNLTKMGLVLRAN